MKKESGNLSFVPFSFYLSCPFKIGYFNLGVFLLPLTKTELWSFGWRTDHIWKLPASQSIRALWFYFPILFFFTFSCRDRAAWPRCCVRAHGAAGPCVHLGSVEMIWMWVGQGPISGCNNRRSWITAGNICLQRPDFSRFPPTLSGRWEGRDQEAHAAARSQSMD